MVTQVELANKECNWSKFEPVLRAAFFKLQSSHLIKVLHISGDDLQIPPDILVHWTSLTELSFNQQAMLILANELVPWEILWQEVPRLETLSIFSVGIDAMLTILLPLLGTYKWQLLTYLKFLVVDFTDPKEFSLIECFILRMAKRLEKVTFVDLFSLTPMKMFFFYSPRDPLGYLNLRTVVIKENSFKPKETQMAIANSIATFASYCPNLEHLRLLPLSWYFSDINEDLHMDWELKQFDSSNWAQLDDVLSTLKSFKSLWVALDFHYTEEEWKQRVNQHLVDEVRNCLGSSVLFPQLWKSVKQNGKDGTVRVGVWFSRDDLTDSEGPKDIIFGNAPEW